MMGRVRGYTGESSPRCILISHGKGAMVNEEVKLYILFAVAGAVAGFIRFMESKRKFTLRTVITSSLISAIASTFIISWWFDGLVLVKPIKCTTLACALGYAQPNIVRLIELITGIDLSSKKGCD